MNEERLHELEREVLRRKAVQSFPHFLDYTDPNYSRQWFHTLIAEKCQDLLLGRLATDRLMVFVPPQHGKALEEHTPVLTTQGWKTHGSLQSGDYVFGADGHPRRVLANSGTYLWPCQRIEFAGGVSLLAAPQHEWQIYSDHDDHKGRVLERVETQQIFVRRHRRKPYIPADAVLQNAETELPFDPYVLGLWLGDGIKKQGTIVSGDEDIGYYRSIALGKITLARKGYWRIRVEGLCKAARLLGLHSEKHIPMTYLLADASSRWALLQGIMDSDGTCDTRGNCEFAQKRGRLAEDVYTLLRSLGIKARKRHYRAKLYGKDCGEKTRILFNPDRTQTIFRNPRKQNRLSDKTANDRDDKKRFFIERVVDVESRRVNCIEVEGGMYLAGRDLIPTHNSEIVSRKFPAWALGYNPKLKIVGTSYAANLAQGFSRSIQRTIDSPEYKEVFPCTFLNSQNVSTDARRGYLRNIDIFETVGHGGFYRAVGVGGGLTGTPVDLGIIDDPVKDALEAASQTYRDRVWEWYTDVFLTRLHNNSKQCLIMTRWHEDDLAGRLLRTEPEKWTVIRIPAIREDMDFADDPREIGEALWEEKHSVERLREAEKRAPRPFAALYQQRPSVEGGNIIKREWFGTISQADFARIAKKAAPVFFIDTAYTDKTTNDPTGIIATCKVGNDLYITHGQKVHMKFPDLLRFIPSYVETHGYTSRSSIRIEPKANGLSVIDQLKESTGLNVTKTPTPKESKETRLNAVSPIVECGRVILVDGVWTEGFIEEVCGFPSKPHDEYVDVLCYAIGHHLGHSSRAIDRESIARMVF